MVLVRADTQIGVGFLFLNLSVHSSTGGLCTTQKKTTTKSRQVAAVRMFIQSGLLCVYL